MLMRGIALPRQSLHVSLTCQIISHPRSFNSTTHHSRDNWFHTSCRRHPRPLPILLTSPSASSKPISEPISSSTSTPPYDYNNEEDDDDDEDPEFALILAACGIGLATGGSVVAFNDVIHFIRDSIWHGETLLTGRELLQKFSEFELWPRIVFPPVVGGLFVGVLGLLVKGYNDPLSIVVDPKINKNTDTNNTAPSRVRIDNDNAKNDDDDDEQQKRQQGEWRTKAMDSLARSIARAVAASVTLGTGASLGPEGPSVDIGSSFAKGMNSILRDPQRHLTSLVAAGSGAGVAAGFNAPIAGVFFAVETVLQKQLLRAVASNNEGANSARKQAQRMEDSSALTIAMVLLASVIAAVVSQAGLGSSPAFRVPEYRLQSLYELPLYLVFGAICGAVSASFSYSSRVAEDAFNELRQRPDGSVGLLGSALLPALGGLTTGVLALGYPEILYQGFDNVNSVLSSSGQYAPGLLIQIVVLKIIATTISRGSGLQGGIYAPSIFIGAALGSAFGLFVHGVGDPSGLLLSAPQAYALVGVGAMLASNCGVPLTAILLLFELTRDYLIIVPGLATVGISFWISSLAAPGVTSAAARRSRKRAAALAAASASPSDSKFLEMIKERMLDGALLAQGTAQEQASTAEGEDPSALPTITSLASASEQQQNEQIEQVDHESLLLACAADTRCFMLQEDLSLGQALALMEAEQQNTALIIGSAGRVMGIVSRDVARNTGE